MGFGADSGPELGFGADSGRELGFGANYSETDLAFGTAFGADAFGSDSEAFGHFDGQVDEHFASPSNFPRRSRSPSTFP